MKHNVKIALWAVTGIVLPILSQAQDDSGGLTDELYSLHGVLDGLYNQMIPLCSQLIGVGQLIAGFAALWYIAARIWRHLASAEPIDFYPLFRPFAIGFAIMVFPSVIDMINGVMQPTVVATSAMVTNSDEAVAFLLKQKEEAVKQSYLYQMYVGESGEGDRDKWYEYTHPGKDVSDEGTFESIGDDIKFAMAKATYNFRNSIKEWMSEILQVLYAAASLCINTIRTFNLIILAILGPLVFGFSVFDGFHHTLRHWLARYINVFLWLPVANIFGSVMGKIQENMLKIDIAQVNTWGETYFSNTDMGYLIFMVIGIIGYFSVPSIANYIMHVGGGGDAIGSKATALTMGAAGGAISGGTSVIANGMNRLNQGEQMLMNSSGSLRDGYNTPSSGTGMYHHAGRAFGKLQGYMRNKLSGDDKME
ncbi:conjugative transposon protein TraJ [Ilyomonas limi]|uniref:Conjugative transposon protein TraJ n=1 Tax=Ilyomonas limi TaxID=2575867 RepID=A0A4U3KYU4_9BACT|nr:conjugative transposon protein TraJ [Ilyomonas limi]TKK66336.1 conjugative transposon protein TraJ [Ilyomonas limi]